MELEKLAKANELEKRLLRYKKSKEHLDYFTKDKEHIVIHMYIGGSGEPFVVPEPLAKRVTDLLHEMLNEQIKEVEQQFKSL